MLSSYYLLRRRKNIPNQFINTWMKIVKNNYGNAEKTIATYIILW
jgi:hypothetical protein